MQKIADDEKRENRDPNRMQSFVYKSTKYLFYTRYASMDNFFFQIMSQWRRDSMTRVGGWEIRFAVICVHEHEKSGRHCTWLQHTAIDCNTLQHTATHCNTLQHTATHCNTLQHNATHYNTLQYTATHCYRLQHTATHYYTLLHTVTHCNTLQHTLLHCTTYTNHIMHWHLRLRGAPF